MEASVATPAQGTPPPAAQPPASGQGANGNGATGDGKGSDGSFNWGLFPGVPENQRELLQPHLRDVLGHVTKLEQQYSPYKGLMEAVPADQVQNLVQFLSNYSQDPLATFVGLAQSLQEDGAISNPDFSVDALQALINGVAQGQADTGMQQPGAEDMPPWAQQMAQQLQQMNGFIEQQQQTEQQRQAQAEAQQQEQLLGQATTQIRESLKNAGIPEGIITDEQITGALITFNGDMNQVVQSFTHMRDGLLKGFTEQNGSGSRPPTVNGEVPAAPRGSLRPRGGDAFRSATIGAEQMLRQGAAAAAQGS